jgi:hypothetical protein
MSRTGCISDQVQLTALEPGTVVEVATHSRTYRIECPRRGELLISGHSEFCPRPLSARVGSAGSQFIPNFIGIGMRLEAHCSNGVTFRTSPIIDIQVLAVGLYRGQYKIVDTRSSSRLTSAL